MVKVAGPLMSADAKGTLADVLTYQGGFGKHRVTRKPGHRDVQSSGQVTQRVVFLAARDEWSWLSAAEKAEYDEVGQSFQMTGYNYFLKEFLKGRIKSDTRLLLPMHEGRGLKVYDHSGYGNDGDIHGASWEQLASGLWVLSFDGLDNYVDIGDDDSIANIGTDDFSAEAWIKTLASGDRYVYGQEVGVMERWWLFMTDGTTAWGGRDSTGALVMVYSTFTIADGLWHHLCGTFTRAATGAKFYIDGKFNNSGDSTGLGSVTNGKMNIGRIATVGYWDGFIEGAKIYNRVLSVGMVRRHYLEGRKYFSF